MSQYPHHNSSQNQPYGYSYQEPYAPGRGQDGVYWGHEIPNMTGRDAYGNPIPKDAKLMSVLSHLSSLAGTVVSLGILPFFGPLIFWLIYKDRPEYTFVSEGAKNAFNFNFTVWIVNVASVLLAVFTLGLLIPVPLVVLSVTGVVLAIFHIVGAVKAYNGEVYAYPFKLRVLR